MNQWVTPLTTETVWVVDDDRSIRWVLEKALSKEKINCTVFASAEAVLKKLKQEQPSVLVTDIRMPGIDGLELLTAIQIEYPHLPVIVMTAHSDLDSAVASFQGGAFEYLPKPFDIDDALSLIKRGAAHYRERHTQQEALYTPPIQQTEIIGEAPAMQEVFRAIGRLAQANITVLICGSSGTGKELVAQALHKHSPRSQAPFIALNMAAIPKDLMESELFGHEKGAFTGANQLRQGRFEQASNGTLFLDEIGDMPLDTQTRLLRVLSDGEFYRVGGHTTVRTDVRIIAATHQNLEKLVNSGLFREDLFHRLNVIRIQLPTLNERREDIPKLAHHFLKRAAKELNVETKTLPEKTEQYLSTIDWNGNVRQLENTCRWLTVMASGREILLSDLPPELQPSEADEKPITHNRWEDALRLWANEELSKGRNNILDTTVPSFERVMIEVALKHTTGRKREAAQRLGWGRNTLTRKLKELCLDTDESDEK